MDEREIYKLMSAVPIWVNGWMVLPGLLLYLYVWLLQSCRVIWKLLCRNKVIYWHWKDNMKNISFCFFNYYFLCIYIFVAVYTLDNYAYVHST